MLPALETFGVKRHADTVMPDDLAKVAATAPENIEFAREWVTSETLLHLQGQAAQPRRMSVCPVAIHIRTPEGTGIKA